MKTLFNFCTSFSPRWLAVLLALPTSVHALLPNPDLTAAGAIAALKADDLLASPQNSPRYSETYNLGATGLRGWIYIGGGNGADGTITISSRQILVTVASAPGNAVLAVDDVILGAMAGSSGTVPAFTSDARKTTGLAISEAEKAGAGTLRVKRWRAGVTTDENIAMTIMGDYTATAPYSCPKSELILANARNKLVSQLLADSNFLSNGWTGAINGLALLAGVQSGDPNYATVQTRLQTFARAQAAAGPVDYGLPNWDWGYMGLFLAEYYLSTGDANVLPGINAYTLKLVQSQGMYGTFGHGPSVLRPDGTGRRVVAGYGPVNQVGIVCNTAIVMGRKALAAGAQAIDPQIDAAIQRGSDFFAFYVNKGPIPYGEHEPFIDGHSSNGKDPLCAVLFGVQAGRTVETEYFARMTTASFTGREYGHTGQGFSYLWSAMGANMGGSLAVAEYLKPVRWHLDLSRRTDGSFVYDGGEQYGAGETAGNTYLGASGYYGMNATASYILTYGLPLQRLYITGKNAIPANTLDAAKVANAIAAATFKQDCTAFRNTQLIAALSEYDPVVRHYAAIELAKNNPALSAAELTTLRNMISGPDANGRMAACQVLGLLQDLTALPLITNRLNKVTETNPWVRAKAASAIRSYTPATASGQLTPMLTAFAANATDPDVIVWDDPIQMTNNFLSLALFGDAIYGGNSIRDYTINAAKSLLYPAVQAGLEQPDSYSRSGASRFCFDKLPLADVQALIPDFFKVIEIECQADRMWNADSRANGIKTFSKYKISEGIPYALAMLDIPDGFGWGSDTTIIAGLNALAAYGDAARWTLPTLRGYIGEWGPTSSSYPTLISTITAIENAITAAAQAPGLAVANSQVVVTTGAKAITLTGASPRGTVTFTNVTAPAHGTLTGTAPTLTYTPTAGYTGPDRFTFQVLDSLGASNPSAAGTVSIIVGTAGTGLKGEYFDNMDFTTLKLTRTDATVNFDWGTGTPNAALGADTFSVRWGGLLLVPETGTYTFSTLNSDGARLYVNGLPVIDDYVDQTTNWKDGTPVNLTAGQMVDLHLRYYENTGSAVAKLKWTGPSFAGANGAIIGTQWLYDGAGVIDRTAYAHAQSLTLIQNTPQPITLTGSGGTLTYTVITPPAHGTLTGTAPYVTYTPATNYNGTDSFTFLVNNGTSNSSPATVSIGIWAGQPVGFTWASAVSGNMSTAASWNPATAPAAVGQPFYNLNFTPAGTYTATHDLSTGFAFNQLNFAGAVTLSGTNTIAPAGNGPLLPQINQNSASAVTVSVPLNLTTTTMLGGTGAGLVTLTGLISGTGGLTKDGPSGLRVHGYDVSGHLAAPNTFSGGTTINSGTLIWGTMDGGVSPPINAALGTGPVTINPGGILEFERVDNAINLLICNGGTVYSNNGWGAKWGGPVTLNAVTTVDATWNMTFNGNISGAGGITTQGGRIVTLAGTNSFTGANKVTAGTLTITKAAALGTGALDITTGAVVALNYTGTRTIAALTLNGGAPLAPGTYGSATHNAYFSGTGTVTILPGTTTALALTSGSTPSNPGLPLTFTATVTGTSPTGNVAFYDGTTLLGTSALSGAVASFTTSSLAIGSHSITAQYAGNGTNATSTSTALAVEIISLLPPAPTNLVAAPGSNHIGLTWTVSAGADSYYVKRSLTAGGTYTVIGNPSGASYDDLTAVNGTAYYYKVSAINAAGESGNSSQVSGTPALVPSTTTLVSSPDGAAPYGTAVTFTATVTAAGGPATGTVTFKDGATVLGTGTLSAGTATLVTSTLAVANHSITAAHDADTSFAGSTSAPFAYVVTAKILSITGVTASNKVYDGDVSAELTAGTISGGVVGSETVTVVPGGGTFASANAGTWAVTATGFALGGANAGNYTLAAQPTVPNATITARPLQLGGTRTYDGTVTAAAANLTISNKVSGDDLILAGSATLAAKDVGPQALLVNYATPVRVQSKTGFSAASTSTSFGVTLNAAPTNGNTLVAVISSRGTTADRVTGITSTGAVWVRVAQSVNGNGSTTEIWSAPVGPGAAAGVTVATVAGRCAGVVIEYSGILTTDAVDQTAASPGANSTTPATGTSPTTTQANELWIGGIGYRSSTPTLSALLNSFASVASAVTTSTTAGNNVKVYALESIVSATGTASSGGTLTASVQWSGAIATFKAASTSTLALSGTAAANYTLSGLTGALAITPKALTLTAPPSVTSKTYNGLTAATLTGATLRVAETPGTGTTGDGTPYTGDALILTLSGTFDTKDAATGKAVTSTSTLAGAQKDNYTLTQPGGLFGDIVPADLSVTASDQSKTYGQPLIFGSSSTQFTSSALQNGELIESVTLACSGGDGAAGVAGSPYPITPSAATGTTFTAANYTISYAPGTLTVNPADQAITFGALATKTYGNAPFALTATAGSGLTVSYLSSDPTVASVAGTMVTLWKAGATTITASQAGDANFSAATPVAQTLTVNAAATTTTLSTSGSPSIYGGAVTLTATVVPASSSGTVQFYDNAVALASPLPLNDGQAQLITSTLATGTHSITATYSGTANHNGSTATAMTQTVTKATPTITTAPTATDISYGQTLANSTLSGGAASVAGSFAFTEPATAPSVGMASHSVTFTPSDPDNYQTAATSVSVTVNVAETTFEAWAAEAAQELTAGENDGPLDDPDYDGISNLMEYALKTVPTKANPAPLTQDFATVGTSQYLRLKVVRNPAASDIEYVFEVNDDLTSNPWTEVPTVVNGDEVSGTDTAIVAASARRFMRLKIRVKP